MGNLFDFGFFWAYRLFDLTLIGIVLYGAFKAISFVLSKPKAYKKALAEMEQQEDADLARQGHSPEYVDKNRQLRSLRKKRFEHKGTLIVAWISGIIALLVFPPLGIAITGFALIVTIREGSKAGRELRATNQQIAEVEQNMPER